MLPAALLHVINMLYKFIRSHHSVRPAVNAQRLEAVAFMQNVFMFPGNV